MRLAQLPHLYEGRCRDMKAPGERLAEGGQALEGVQQAGKTPCVWGRQKQLLRTRQMTWKSRCVAFRLQATSVSSFVGCPENSSQGKI